MQQLICDTQDKILYIYENNYLIKTIKNIALGINGVTSNKKENDGKTPLGEYSLGLAFSFHKLNISYPHFVINDDLYWVDDINSPYYNQLVDIKQVGQKFQSAEHLSDYKIEYEYGLVINYNEKCLKGKGSAIFLHVKNQKNTHGCIAIEKEDMLYILNFLQITEQPIIKII